MAFASSRVMRSRAPVNTTVFPATGDDGIDPRQRLHIHVFQKIVDDFHVVLFAEEAGDGVAHDPADTAVVRKFEVGFAVTRFGGLHHLAQEARARVP